MTPYGCVNGRSVLDGSKGGSVTYPAVDKASATGAPLNPFHTHYVFIDSGKEVRATAQAPKRSQRPRRAYTRGALTHVATPFRRLLACTGARRVGLRDWHALLPRVDLRQAQRGHTNAGDGTKGSEELQDSAYHEARAKHFVINRL